jgi:hypothetical protein
MRRNCLGRVLRAIECIARIGLNAKEVDYRLVSLLYEYCIARIGLNAKEVGHRTCIIIIRVLLV